MITVSIVGVSICRHQSENYMPRVNTLIQTKLNTENEMDSTGDACRLSYYFLFPINQTLERCVALEIIKENIMRHWFHLSWQNNVNMVTPITSMCIKKCKNVIPFDPGKTTLRK